MSQKVLIVDIGTQSMRGVVFDQFGSLVLKEQVVYSPYMSKENGFVEQSMDIYIDTFCQITKQIFKKHPDIAKDITAISVDTFRDTAVLLDEQNNVLRNLILWSDQRVADTKQKLPFVQRAVFGLVGMKRPINAIRKKIKTRWVAQNEPELWQKVKKVVHISAYFHYFLCGKLVDSYASTIGHLPFSNKDKTWLKPKDLLMPVFDLPLEMMCDLCAPGDLVGTITKECSQKTGIPAGMKVFACGSDKGCETLGVGCLTDDIASVSFGTSSTVQFFSQKYFEPEPFMPSYPAVVKYGYNPEVQIFRGYWMISWFKKNFAEHLEKRADELGKSVEEVMNEEIEAIPAGCDGLILQPFWQAGLTSPEARGAVIGFSDYHTRAHVYRAIIEGIDFALREGIERMEKRGKTKIKYISVSGGGSQSDLICQIAADIFNKPVRRVQTFETSGLGGAIVTFTALGVYKDEQEAIKHMVHYKDEFLPDPQNAQKYDDIFNNIYLKLYSKLQNFYRKMEEKQ